MLKMENNVERYGLTNYFYPSGSSLLNKVMWISLLLFWTGFGAIIFLICVVIKIFSMFANGNPEAEKRYDFVRPQDVEYLRTRAVQQMGLVDEEMSLIDPIVASGYADESAVKYGKEITANETKKGFFSRVLDAVISIPAAIIQSIAGAFGAGEVMSKAMFVEGSDKKVRSSLARVVMISFTEQQVLAYVCEYDVALGIILNEHTSEIFYRDIDAVSYGAKLLYVWSDKKKKYLKTPVEEFRLAVGSGNDIWASITGEAGILENQVTAAKSLVRSKKEEMK